MKNGETVYLRPLDLREDEQLVLIGDAIAAGVFSPVFYLKLSKSSTLTKPADNLAGTGSERMPIYQEIEALIERQKGLTELQMAKELRGLHAYQQTVNPACRWLVRERRVERKGQGGPSDPFRYYPAGSA